MTVLWVNGAPADPDAPVAHADDHGLVVGDGVFESVKVIDGRPFALTRHLDRLARSAAGLHLSYDHHSLRESVDAALAAMPPMPVAKLRITVTAGRGPYGSGRGSSERTVLVAISPLDPWPETVDVVTVPWPRNERGALAGLKTTSYAENVVALHYANERGAGEAVFSNIRGELCEGTGTNVFVGLQGRLVTPPLTSGCLAGVTRGLLVEWLPDWLEERSLPTSQLAEADEAFLASTTRDVQPIRAVDGHALPTCPGPLTRRAMEVFAEHSARMPDP